MVRTPSTDKNGLKKGAWSEEEDNKLKAYIQRYGHWNWRQLPKFAGLSRCGKSCRLRWMNYLRPGVKRGNYSVEEEDLIAKLHEQYGNRWSAIAAKVPGRTDNEIKNYWNTHLRKRMKQHSESSKIAEQSSEKSQHMDVADQNQLSSEMPSFDPKQKSELIEPETIAAADGNAYTSEMPSLFSSASTRFEGMNWLAGESNSSEESFTEPFESFWTQPFVLDTSYNNNNQCLPPVEEEFMNSFSSFVDDDMDWLQAFI